MRRVAALLAALLVLAAVAPSPLVAAQSDSDRLVSIDVTDDLSLRDTVSAFLSAGWHKATLAYDRRVNDPPDADAQADRIVDHLNTTNASWVTHLNDALDEHNGSAGTGTFVAALEIEDDAGDVAATVYVIGEADGDTVTDLRATRSYDGTVDDSARVDAYEARELADDLESYHDDYVAAGEVPDPSVWVSLAGKYANVSEIKADHL